ncbi:MAG: penicillin acylase family protein [Pirellulaceae bacterium]|nr:penicillin acylase family protein [Pirellulaceae bacterium]
MPLNGSYTQLDNVIASSLSSVRGRCRVIGLPLAGWLVSCGLAVCWLVPGPAAAAEVSELAQKLASRSTIYRDQFGVPHIDARDLPAAAFAFGYCQCEDYFWQVEDSIVWSLGRYAELNGATGVDSDTLTHAFEIPRRTEQDYVQYTGENREVGEAFIEGLNYYLAKNPDVKPRLLTRFEPWHLLALGRRVYLELSCLSNHINTGMNPMGSGDAVAQIGSNAWAVGPSKTAAGSTMLFINPHQPFYGYGQWYEGHIRTDDGIDFYGAAFFGSPLPAIGHNHRCGWSFTVNEPDVFDVWNVKFESDQPNHYRHGEQLREATQWQQEIKVKGQPTRRLVLRKTHHGPIVKQNKDGTFQAYQCANLFEHDFLSQLKQMLRSENVYQVRDAMGMQGLPIFNTVAADDQGNILYLYSGVVPRRDPAWDWTKPVDGNDPRTDWRGLHTVDELPQVINPPTGYVQSCNATPFTTTDDGNPSRLDFPPYMVTDQHDDKRRAQVSRSILRAAQDLTLDQFENLAFDTRLYWAINELPALRRHFARLEQSTPALAEQARPYLQHFDGWDCRVSVDCTRSALCVAWYEELYGFGYPAETLKPEYVQNPDKKFEALVKAANKLQSNFKNWKVRWGDIYRLQRHPNVANLIAIPFSDRKPSIPCAGAPGPLGIVFTVYYTPSIFIPLLRETRNQYAVVGASYSGVVEFSSQGVRSKSLHNYGSSSDPNSPHYFDQAQLMSESRMKDTLFDWQQIRAQSPRSYHAGSAASR